MYTECNFHYRAFSSNITVSSWVTRCIQENNRNNTATVWHFHVSLNLPVETTKTSIIWMCVPTTTLAVMMKKWHWSQCATRTHAACDTPHAGTSWHDASCWSSHSALATAQTTLPLPASDQTSLCSARSDQAHQLQHLQMIKHIKPLICCQPTNPVQSINKNTEHCTNLWFFWCQRFNYWCLQCFDAVGWAAGRASGL